MLVLLKLDLGSGLDCVGEVIPGEEDEPSPFVRFKALRVLGYKQTDPQTASIAAFMYFMFPVGDAEVEIREHHIVTMMPCPEKLAEAYRRALTPIEIPPRPPLVIAK